MDRTSRKIRVGKVISNKMHQTVIVAVEWRQRHPIYKKSVRHITKLMAHDANNSCNVGDTVNVMETRPLSKTKRWRVTEILSSNFLGETQENQADPILKTDTPSDETTEAETNKEDVTASKEEI